MKLIKSSYKIIPQEAGLEGIYKAIERAGRTCYKSSDKITDTSAKEFVDRMIKSGHGAMLEHGTVYLDFTDDITEARKRYIKNPYSKVYKNTLEEDWDYPHLYVVTNLRVLVENNWLDDLQYICEPTEFHERRITVHFVCDRGVSHEFVRHRVMSFAQESTRYCNYSKDKFGNELTFIIPNWFNNEKQENISLKNIDLVSENKAELLFKKLLCNSETTYNKLLKEGWKPQEARAVLPNALKTELVVTGFTSDWEKFFGLRCDKAAHPQARELAIPLQEEFIKRGYIN